MKMFPGALAALGLLALSSPAAAMMHGGGFHGGGFHGGFHGGHFHDGHFHGAPFFGFGLGLGYGYPWYGYSYSYATPVYYPSAYAYPSAYGAEDYACGTWIWHPETRSYGWLACGATSELIVPTAPAPPPTQP
jgi:hypothetical protein